MDSEIKARALRIYGDIFAEACSSGLVEFRSERIPYSKKYQQPILGSFIGGECPSCKAPDLGGFYCEDCGLEASPEDLIGFWSEFPDDEYEWRQYSSAFLSIPDVDEHLAQLRARCDSPGIVDVAMASLKFNGQRTRLTHPTPWGAPVHHAGLSQGSVFFSYPGMYALSVLCGELAKEKFHLPSNPFDKDSDAVLVKSFGFDNTAPYLLGATSLGKLTQRWRGFDHYLPNYFATLDGQKFSTSARHAIWADEALQELGTSSDTLRAFMCKENPQHAIRDFSRSEFNAFKIEWDGRIHALLSDISVGTPSSEDCALFLGLYQQQQRLLMPESLDVHGAFKTLNEWIEVGEQKKLGAFWHRAFSLLSFPFMPNLSCRIASAQVAEATIIPSHVEGPGYNDLENGFAYISRSPKDTLITYRNSGVY